MKHVSRSDGGGVNCLRKLTFPEGSWGRSQAICGNQRNVRSKFKEILAPGDVTSQ